MTDISFTASIQGLRAERRNLLMRLDHRVNGEDQTPTDDLPLDWGIAGDLQRDIELLKQLLRLEQ